MNNHSICEFYDSHPDLTLAQLSVITGLSVARLKQILMS